MRELLQINLCIILTHGEIYFIFSSYFILLLVLTKKFIQKDPDRTCSLIMSLFTSKHETRL